MIRVIGMRPETVAVADTVTVAVVVGVAENEDGDRVLGLRDARVRDVPGPICQGSIRSGPTENRCVS